MRKCRNCGDKHFAPSKVHKDRVVCVGCGCVQDDPVNHPAHYNTGKIEVIEYLEDKLGADGFEAYCIGNVLKYVSRYKHKGGLEDLKKARWYLDRVINHESGD